MEDVKILTIRNVPLIRVIHGGI